MEKTSSSTSKKTKPPTSKKFAKFKSNLRNKKKTRISTKPINPAKLFVHELKNESNYDLHQIVSENRREFYIHIYKSVFRCWFTYAITGILLALCHTFVRSAFSFCFPPLVVTIFLLWKVSLYKKKSHNFTITEMELLNQTQSAYFTFKTAEARRQNQGVLLAYLKERSYDIDTDLEELFDTDDSDVNLESDDEMTLDEYKNKKLVGYLIYSKQRDEEATVCIKELCIEKSYRKRKIATNFLKKVCLNTFKTYGYKRVQFQLSSFNWEALAICQKKASLIARAYCWVAYKFLPGVCDERSMYLFEIDKLK